MLSNAAALGRLSSPGVIISQVSYWAADSLIGYGRFSSFPLFHWTFFYLPSFFLSVVLDLYFALSAERPPSLLLPAPPSKLEPNLSISPRLDSNRLTSAVFSPGLIPHNNVRARTKLTAETVNHALLSALFSLTTDDELRRKLITWKAAALPHRNTSAG